MQVFLMVLNLEFLNSNLHFLVCMVCTEPCVRPERTKMSILDVRIQFSQMEGGGEGRGGGGGDGKR
jgi:hypothetical protein